MTRPMSESQIPSSPPDLDLTPWPAEVAQRYRALGLWTGDLLGDIAVQHIGLRPGGEAVIGPDARLTYAELEQEVQRLAVWWRGLGWEPGDYVVVQLPNTAAFVATVLSLWRAGLVPVMALANHRRAEVSAFVAQTNAVGHVCADGLGGANHAALAVDICSGAPGLVTVLVGADGSHSVVRDPRPRATRPRQLPEGWDDLPPSGRVALLQLSGGSTGTPKLIPRTHDDYLLSVRESNPICGTTADTRYLVALPCAHNFAMSSPGILGVLQAGGTVVMAPEPSPATAFALVEAERITMTAVVPPVAMLWLRAANRRTHDLSTLESLLVGGARLPDSVASQVRPILGCRLRQVFGMAEGLVNYTRDEDDEHTVTTTQGRPISPYDELRVVDDHDHDVPDGEPGHLLTRGPYTIRGYFRAGAHNARAFTADGFYRTGDVVVRHPSGHLTVVGRAKDQVNRGGEKIAVVEVESHLLTHPGVAEVSVIAEPDELLGERACAVLVPTGDPPSVSELRQHLHERGLADYKIPDRFIIADELPRTRVGKTDVGAIRHERTLE